MSRSSHSHTTNPPEGQVIITRARISGISEVMMNEEVRRTNLQIAQDILRQIEEASKDGSVEIIFADDIRKYIALLQEEGLSPLVIDSRLQIRLPLYELTLDLPPLAKALYMLYMRHPEGLYRKQIADCREELLWLYSACLGRRVDSDMRRTIDHLTDFSTKNADKQMSLINRSFRRALADKADHYIPVSAKRGERKCLDFSRVSFHLPSFLSGDFLSGSLNSRNHTAQNSFDIVQSSYCTAKVSFDVSQNPIDTSKKSSCTDSKESTEVDTHLHPSSSSTSTPSPAPIPPLHTK